jgi:hypothetical protein
VGKEPSDADKRQTEEEKNLNWEADKVDKRRDQQRVTDLQGNLSKDWSS